MQTVVGKFYQRTLVYPPWMNKKKGNKRIRTEEEEEKEREEEQTDFEYFEVPKNDGGNLIVLVCGGCNKFKVMLRRRLVGWCFSGVEFRTFTNI